MSTSCPSRIATSAAFLSSSRSARNFSLYDAKPARTDRPMDVRDVPEVLAADAESSPGGRCLTTRAVEAAFPSGDVSSFVMVFLRMRTSFPLRYRCFSFFLPSWKRCREIPIGQDS